MDVGSHPSAGTDYAKFGADYYNYVYKALRESVFSTNSVANNVLALSKLISFGVGSLLIALGLFQCTLFGYKLVKAGAPMPPPPPPQGYVPPQPNPVPPQQPYAPQPQQPSAPQQPYAPQPQQPAQPAGKPCDLCGNPSAELQPVDVPSNDGVKTWQLCPTCAAKTNAALASKQAQQPEPEPEPDSAEFAESAHNESLRLQKEQEQERARRCNALTEEKAALEAELPTLGKLAFGRKEAINARLAEIDAELKLYGVVRPAAPEPTPAPQPEVVLQPEPVLSMKTEQVNAIPEVICADCGAVYRREKRFCPKCLRETRPDWVYGKCELCKKSDAKVYAAAARVPGIKPHIRACEECLKHADYLPEM